MRIDEVDLSIVKQLQANGRSSNREVGRVLGLSEGTIRQRLRKLEQANLMRLTVVTDPRTVGRTAAAYVRIRAEPRHARNIAQTIAGLPSCAFSGLTMGRFDVIALLTGSTRAELAQVIDNEIAAMPGVIELDIREPVGYAKHRYDLIHIP